MVFMAGIPAQQPQVAYFSMEIGLDLSIPTYSGGLGLLAQAAQRVAHDIEKVFELAGVRLFLERYLQGKS